MGDWVRYKDATAALQELRAEVERLRVDVGILREYFDAVETFYDWDSGIKGVSFMELKDRRDKAKAEVVMNIIGARR